MGLSLRPSLDSLWGLLVAIFGHSRGSLVGSSGELFCDLSKVSLGILRGFSGHLILCFLGTSSASCAEPSGARLRAADQAFNSLAIVRAHQGSQGSLIHSTGTSRKQRQSEVQIASLQSRSVTLNFAHIPLARFPFLLSQVSTMVVDGPLSMNIEVFQAANQLPS